MEESLKSCIEDTTFLSNEHKIIIYHEIAALPMQYFRFLCIYSVKDLMHMKIEPLTFRRKLALEIARYMENKRVKEHPLRQLFWECTLRCNLNCRHCGSDCKKTAGIVDMPKEDFLRVLDSVAKRTDPLLFFSFSA